MTPLLNPSAVVELLEQSEGPSDPRDQATFIRRGLNYVFPGESCTIEAAHVPDDLLVEVTKEKDVHYATGESDAESIRDYDSGTGSQRWHRRNPYWYCRQPSSDPTRQFRRMMKLRINPPVAEAEPEPAAGDELAAAAEPAEAPPPPPPGVDWEPLVESVSTETSNNRVSFSPRPCLRTKRVIRPFVTRTVKA